MSVSLLRLDHSHSLARFHQKEFTVYNQTERKQRYASRIDAAAMAPDTHILAVSSVYMSNTFAATTSVKPGGCVLNRGLGRRAVSCSRDAPEVSAARIARRDGCSVTCLCPPLPSALHWR